MQQEKTLRLNKIDNKKVQCSLFEYKKLIRGVISGIPTDIPEEQIKDNITGAKVLEVKRLTTNRNERNATACLL